MCNIVDSLFELGNGSPMDTNAVLVTVVVVVVVVVRVLVVIRFSKY